VFHKRENYCKRWKCDEMFWHDPVGFSIKSITIHLAALALSHTRYVPNKHIDCWVLFSAGGIGAYVQKVRTPYQTMVSPNVSSRARDSESLFAEYRLSRACARQLKLSVRNDQVAKIFLSSVPYVS
jgi:hypothetical protein